MRYKVGDKVRVRKDLVFNKRYGGNTFVVGMDRYSGKIMTIGYVNHRGNYIFVGDTERWCWTDEMLESVESINIIVEGNKVIAKRGNKVGIARCSPEDEFNIFTGAKIALDRLEEASKHYSWIKLYKPYYVPAPAKAALFDCFRYANDEVDKRYINRGLVFRTKEEAIEAAKKMLAVLKENDDDKE